MVELLTAIAIIAILASMAFLGFKYVRGSVGTKGSEVALQNLRGFLAEFEAQGGRMKDLLSPYNDAAGTVPLTLTGPPNVPAYEPDNLHLYLPPTPGQAIAPNQPFFDLYATAYKVMPKLRSIPANKAALDGLPAEQVYPRAWSPTKERGKQNPTANDMRTYQQGERVTSKGNTYFCTKTHTVGSVTATPETDTGNWAPDAPMLLVLDPSGVPILFVPPQGAVNLKEGGYTRVIGGTGTAAPKQAPDRKGYFMAAGEDHNFVEGDDNLYSFENK